MTPGSPRRASRFNPGGARTLVRLSLFSVADPFPDPVGHGRDRLAELVALAEAADAIGLAAAWVAEHHFDGTGLCPSPPVLLAAMAARTRRLRLGSLVSVLPFHSPIEVAEEYALVDRLSGGRLNFGVGSGYLPLEFEGFGIDPATKREAFDRALETILTAWRGEPVRAPSPSAVPVRLNVTPLQRPHPPLWLAIQRREAIPFVARRGAGVALIPYATVAGLPELAEEIRDYRAALPAGVAGTVSVAVHVYAGARADAARAALQRYLDSRLATHSAFYQEKVRRDPRQASAEAIERSGFAIFGEVPEVVERLHAFGAAGADEILGLFDFGGLPWEEASASVRALGRALSLGPP